MQGAAAPRLAPFNPTADDAIAAALRLAALRDGDTLLDLGCGDGRLLLAAALACPGVRTRGVEADAELVQRARARVAAAVAGGGAGAAAAALVAVEHGDACAADAAGASVVFVYLVPAGLEKVKPLLSAVLRGGGRVVSNMFRVPGWAHDAHESVRGCSVYLYGAGCAAGGSNRGGGGSSAPDASGCDGGGSVHDAALGGDASGGAAASMLRRSVAAVVAVPGSEAAESLV